ncbi:MAG TPA: Ig-like domain-containing protein [Candidatus Dormibacteraeota bacterium]|nr:Ig-like domain-containing protein [Candidatus Dormibacteraeota bacterium]
MKAPRDPELDALFEELSPGDRALQDFAQMLRSAPWPGGAADPDPTFRLALRRRLLQEAWKLAAQRRQPWYRKLFSTPTGLAWAAAALGALLIGLAGLAVLAHPTRGPQPTVEVASPLNDAHTVAVVQPIELDFSQPMDTRSVEEAVKISPATRVSYQWLSPNRVEITPMSGTLAPNTQYTVVVAPSAKTKDGTALGKPAVVTFVTTAPPASPGPTPSQSPTTGPASQLAGMRQLAPIGTSAPAWSADGSTLYVVNPNGSLEAVAIAGGTRTLASGGVTTVAVGPSGPAYVQNGQVVYGQTTIQGVQPLALGFQGSNLLIGTAQGIVDAHGTTIAAFSETARLVDIAPGGGHAAYLGTSGTLHVVDLASGRDVPVGPATALGDWSSSADRYAYASSGAVQVTDMSGNVSRLAGVGGVTGISWSDADQILLATSSGLEVMNADGTGLHQVASGDFEQPEWSPSGGLFAFKRDGAVWVAQLMGPRPAASPSPTVGDEQDFVQSFLAGAASGSGAQSLGQLDQNGKLAYQRLLQAQPSLGGFTRSYVVLLQPSRAVVRLIYGQGAAQTAIDLTLTLVTDADGGLHIHDLSAQPVPSFGKGPQVLSVSVGRAQVRVQFDSDLMASSVQSGVLLEGVANAQVSYDASSRTVLLVVPGGLTPGATYTLQVTGALEDVNQRAASPYELSFTA